MRRNVCSRAIVACSCLALLAMPAAAPLAHAPHLQSGGETTRVSLASDGAQGNHASCAASISADGRFVAFSSSASNLAPGDTNDALDIFVHDRQTGATTRVSLASDGSEANGYSWRASISADGRLVAFDSKASNLAPDDTNGFLDVFVHDRQTGATTRVSLASDGGEGNGDSAYASISADGRLVAFASWASNLTPNDTNDTWDVFVHDRQTGATTRVSLDSNGAQGNGRSAQPSLSADGRFVAFSSSASNLAPDDTNDVLDIFVHDRQTGATTRVSLASDGSEANGHSWRASISADGRLVAFDSEASNLAPDDTDEEFDVFVHDRRTGATTRVSLDSDGAQGNRLSAHPSLSADGRLVAFDSQASNLAPDDTNDTWDVFVHDRQTGATTRVSLDSNGAQGNGRSAQPSLSADGRFVAFSSSASNLAPDDTNGVLEIFVHDRQTGATTRVSLASDGSEAKNGHSWRASISADGRLVAFDSEASNLVPDDTNVTWDVFVHDRQTGATTRVSLASDGGEGNGDSAYASISADGRLVAFDSWASNLTPDDTNGDSDVFVHDRGEALPGPFRIHLPLAFQGATL